MALRFRAPATAEPLLELSVVTAAAVLPVPANDRLRTGQPSVLEEVPADALHGRSFAGRPHADVRVEFFVLHRVDERVAGRRTRRKVVPGDARTRMFRERDACVGVCDFEVHADRGLGGQGLEELTDRGDSGFVT